MELALRHLGPPRVGLEIGASAINPFPGVRSFNLEHPQAGVFQAAQEAIATRAAPVDVWGLAETLPLRDASVDFVLNSHVIEHMPDTIAALREWDRVVRPGGVLFFIVPHKERTFDAPRPRTPLGHHLADFAVGMDARTDAQVPTSHYHVWTTQDFLDLVQHLVEVGGLDWEVLEVEDVDSKVGNGFTVVVRKGRRLPLPPAPPDTPVALHQVTLALPFQVPGRTIEWTLPGALPEPLPLPRGTYRVVPIHAGFPPRAGEALTIEHGPPCPAPVVSDLSIRDQVLVARGEHLHPTTWLVAHLPDGSRHEMLPEWEDGALRLDVAGLVIPPEPIPMQAVNPPPGGGASEAVILRDHLGG